MAINLFTTYYNERHPPRKEELDTCLIRNLELGLFQAIYLIIDHQEITPPVRSNDETKVFIRRQYRRPTYGHLFNLVNEVTKDDELNVLSNSDIYFDNTLLLADEANLDDCCFALSRWDVMENGESVHRNHADSQDVWIFRGKIKENTESDITIGVPGCDNRMAHELKAAGYQVCNPSLNVKTHHLHLTNHRNYDPDDDFERVPQPYLLVNPTYLIIN